jgi:hypothetical protein
MGCGSRELFRGHTGNSQRAQGSNVGARESHDGAVREGDNRAGRERWIGEDVGEWAGDLRGSGF